MGPNSVRLLSLYKGDIWRQTHKEKTACEEWNQAARSQATTEGSKEKN